MNDTLFTLYILAAVLIIIGLWKIFQKAGYKGWESIIPFYNLYILLKIIDKPWWWMILMFIPWIGMIWSIWATNLLAKTFDKKIGFVIGMVILPFIFYPILGFGNATYTHPGEEDENYSE